MSEQTTSRVTDTVAVGSGDWSPAGGVDPLASRQGSHFGAGLSRVDGPLKVSGAAPFAAEFPFDGMLYAALAFSTIAKGRLTRLDTGAAQAAPGVTLVMTHRNAPALNPAPVFLSAPLAAGGDNAPVLQDDRIRWNGQPVAVVLAESQEQADHAVTLLGLDFEAEPAQTDFAVARRAAHEALPVLGPLDQHVGDVDAALAAAHHRVDVTYTTPRHNHNAIEPHAVTVRWDGEDLFVHDAAQMVDMVAWTLGQVFDHDPARIRVTSPFVGGGFGGKGLWQHHVLAAAAARLAGRPVRMNLTREAVYRLVGGRAATEQRVALGADADGKLTATIHEGIASGSPNSVLPEPFVGPAATMYRTDTRRLGVSVADMDAVANTFMRAPGEAVGTFALESAMDELAVELAMDPIELRLRNEPTVDPSSGLPFSSRQFATAVRAGAARFGWSERTGPRGRREGQWWVGTGVAAAMYPYQRMPGGAARLALARGGHIVVAFAAHEMGMGTATAQAQITAERMAVPVERVTVRYGDSALPGKIMAAGSQQTAAIGASVVAAQRALLQRLLSLLPAESPFAELTLDEVGVRDCGLCRLDDPDEWRSYDDLLDDAGLDEVHAVADAPPNTESQNFSMHSYGAVFSEVLVDAVTGEVRVRRLLGSYDCGRIVNPKTAASQFRGGMIMGIGMALMEATDVDRRTGRVTNASLAEYHVPSHLDVPRIEVMWTDLPDPYSPMGARGVGEIGITGVAAAIANGVYNATGRRIRDLPITLDKTL